VSELAGLARDRLSRVSELAGLAPTLIRWPLHRCGLGRTVESYLVELANCAATAGRASSMRHAPPPMISALSRPACGDAAWVAPGAGIERARVDAAVRGVERECRRIDELVIEGHVFGVGGLIESAAEKEARVGWDKEDAFLRRRLAAGQ
jgi:hypothetical protein